MKLKQVLLTGALALFSAIPAIAQDDAAAAPACGNCVNIAPYGDMSNLPACNQGYLNTFGLNWKSSHGSPSYCPGSLWMWSYNNRGEGVLYDGVTFLPGHTYRICFDTDTKTHDGSAPVADAGFNVIATSSLVPSEITGGGSPIPPIPGASQIIASQPWGPLPNPGSTTFSYTFTATNTWSQLWFYPHASALPQVELTLKNLRICDLTVTDPCAFEPYFDLQLGRNCRWFFYPNFLISAGLQVEQYYWEFGDGSTSNEQYPTHYYAQPGPYVVRLTVLVVNSDGQCCAKTVEQEIYSDTWCDPCTIAKNSTFKPVHQGCNNMMFISSGPDSPGFAYTWDFGDGTTGSGHTVYHQYASPGVYYVTMKAYYYNVEAGICCSYSYSEYVNVFPSDVIQEQGKSTGTNPQPAVAAFPEWLKERPGADAEQALSIFPNPSNGKFTLTAKSQIATVEVHDLSGRIIQTITTEKESVVIDLEAEKPGSYLVKVKLADGSSYDEKLVRK